MSLAYQISTSITNAHTDVNLPTCSPEDRVLLAEAHNRNVTTTISLSSTSQNTRMAILSYLEQQNITHTVNTSREPATLTVRVSEEFARSLLNTMYGFGAFNDAFQLHRNLLRQGIAEGFSYNSVASPEVEVEFCNREQFTITRVRHEPLYAFASGRQEAAVRYTVSTKGTTFDVIIPLALPNHTTLLSSLSDRVDRTSRIALQEINAIRFDIGRGPSFEYITETTGQEIATRAAANANPDNEVVNFFEQSYPIVPFETWWHELAHLVADEFFLFYRNQGHHAAVGITSRASDPWTVWTWAVANDRNNLPDHGDDNPREEDFANAVQQWVADRSTFSALYPARAALISGYDDVILDPSHQTYCDSRLPDGM